MDDDDVRFLMYYLARARGVLRKKVLGRPREAGHAEGVLLVSTAFITFTHRGCDQVYCISVFVVISPVFSRF